MSEIKNFNIVEGISNQLKLQRFFEPIPKRLAQEIRPVFVINEVPNLKTFILTGVVSTQSFTVPQGKQWKIHCVFYAFATSAEVGNRVPVIDILDENNVTLCRTLSNNSTQAASLTRRYTWKPGLGLSITEAGTDIMDPLPVSILKSGWSLHILDRSNVDVGVDTITGSIVYEELQSAVTPQ